MVFYPAFFEDGEGGYVIVSFPDLPGCFTQGDDEHRATAMAADALSGHLLVLHECGDAVPPPSPLSALTVPPHVRVTLIPSEPLKQ